MMGKQNKEEKMNHDRYLQEFTIQLLGRLAFTPEQIKKIVTMKKQNPDNYIKAYNACDGRNSVSALAKIAEVKQPTITKVLQNCDESGIVFLAERTGGKFYKKLFSI